MANIDLSVVIVAWNSGEFLPACLESIYRQKVSGLELILVDNNSSDQTVKRVKNNYPQVKLTVNPKNFGYARACNQGLKQARGEFILLLNPDTLLQPGSLVKMVNYLKQREDTGGVGPQLLYPDGRIQPSCRRFPNHLTLLWEFTGLSRLFPQSPTFGAWRMGDFDFQTEREVDQPMASAFMVRKSVLDQVGFFDEKFRMFFNDVDLCFRIKRAGHRIVFYPEAKVTHHWGGSTGKRKMDMIVHSHWTYFLYLKKYHGSGVKLPLLLVSGSALFLGALMRIALLVAISPFRK